MPALSHALTRLREGGMVVLVDDEDRENEGDLVLAAEFATPEAVNFMAVHGRGLICLALTGEQVDRLRLQPMTAANGARRSTAFTVSIEAREGITTGISAHDRARTILVAAAPDADPRDVVSPGHVFPLRAAEGGVLARNGHTEGSVDLMRLAGLRPAAVICEIMRPDGRMARRGDLEDFARRHGLPVVAIREIALHRSRTETLVEEAGEAALPSAFGGEDLRVHAFRSLTDGVEHLAIVRRPFSGPAPTVRVHSECLTGDALGSLRCDCGAQLQESLRIIGESGGVVVYLRGQEGRGIGLANKIRAYALQDRGYDTVDANTALDLPADRRDYAAAAHILRALGLREVTLLSNNPKKAEGLEEHGVAVTARRPLIVAPNPFNTHYLAAKRDRLGHALGAAPHAHPQH
jgi:3,4-dihydroxy 2-butanone 4-phosphate synthase / GTP cyclohydrolase II